MASNGHAIMSFQRAQKQVKKDRKPVPFGNAVKRRPILVFNKKTISNSL